MHRHNLLVTRLSEVSNRTWRICQNSVSRLHRTGRAKEATDLSELYSKVFPHIIDQHSEDRIEIEIRLKPGDQGVQVSVHVPPSLLARHNPAKPLMSISSTLSGGDGRPVEISDLSISQPDVYLYPRLRKLTAEIYVGDLSRSAVPATLSFKSWELTSRLEGMVPYLYATLAANISFPELSGVPAVVTLVAPEGVAPRSTQGNYSLAYPSRVLTGSRYTNIYFSDAAAIILRYRCADMTEFSMPWQQIGKAAVASAFVFFIAALVPDAQSSDLSERLLAVIGAFVTSAGTLWDFIRELALFAIYGHRDNRISYLVLGCQLAVITMMTLILVRLSVAAAAPVLSVVPFVTLILTIVLVITAIGGFVLHALGWWQRFSCDHTGCNRHLRIRRGRPECQYTGRVFCDQHIMNTCSSCSHGADLRTRRLDSIGSHQLKSLPCLAKSGSVLLQIHAATANQNGGGANAGGVVK